MIKKIWLFLFLVLLYIPEAFAVDASLVVPFISITLGIFVALSFIIITVISKKNELGMGPWPFIAIAVLFLALDEYFRAFQNMSLHPFFITASMTLFFFTALFKYWDMMRIVQ